MHNEIIDGVGYTIIVWHGMRFMGFTVRRGDTHVFMSRAIYTSDHEAHAAGVLVAHQDRPLTQGVNHGNT